MANTAVAAAVAALGAEATLERLIFEALRRCRCSRSGSGTPPCERATRTRDASAPTAWHRGSGRDLGSLYATLVDAKPRSSLDAHAASCHEHRARRLLPCGHKPGCYVARAPRSAERSPRRQRKAVAGDGHAAADEAMGADRVRGSLTGRRTAPEHIPRTAWRLLDSHGGLPCRPSLSLSPVLSGLPKHQNSAEGAPARGTGL
jgi:hypothetical protein